MDGPGTIRAFIVYAMLLQEWPPGSAERSHGAALRLYYSIPIFAVTFNFNFPWSRFFFFYPAACAFCSLQHCRGEEWYKKSRTLSRMSLNPKAGFTDWFGLAAVSRLSSSQSAIIDRHLNALSYLILPYVCNKHASIANRGVS